jgi:hypothetical protein
VNQFFDPEFRPMKVAANDLGVHWSWLRDRRLEGQFVEGIHYRKAVGIRGYLYSVPACKDFLNCGGDWSLHQTFVDEFLKNQRQRRVSKKK